MSFNTFRLGKEEIFETTIRDLDGRKIGEWKVMKSDYPEVLKIINNKFGLGLVIKKKSPEDLGWAI